MRTELESAGSAGADNRGTARTGRRAALGALGVTAALLLAGCGSGPSQPGAAAIVGDVTIPLEEVQQRLNTYLTKASAAGQPQQQNNAQTALQIVSLRIQHELTRVAAERAGVSVSEEELTSFFNEYGPVEELSKNSFYDPQTFRDERVRDQLLWQKLGTKYADTLTVTYDFTLASSQEEATEKAKRIAADPERALDVIEADRQAQLPTGTDQRDTPADQPQLGGSALFGVPAGSVVAFQPDEGNGTTWMVAYVRARDFNGNGATGSATSTTSPSSQLDPTTLAAIGLRAIQPIGEELGVRVNPRYGVWDQVAMSPRPSEPEKVGYVAKVREKTSA